MKKILAAALTILAVAAALMIQGSLAVPGIRELSGAVCEGEGGRMYVAGFGKEQAGVYGLDTSGRIVRYQPLETPGAGEEYRVLRLCSDETVMYWILEKRNVKTRITQSYELWGVDWQSGEIVAKTRVSPELFERVTDLTVEDGTVTVSGIAEDGRCLAGYTAGGEAAEANLSLLYLQPVPGGETAADCVYFGKTVFVRTGSGRIGKYTDHGYVDIRQEEAPEEGNFLVKGEGGVWSYERETGRMAPVSRGASGGFTVPANVRAESGFVSGPSLFGILGIRGDGTRVLGRQVGNAYREWEELVPSPALSLQFGRSYLLRTLCGAAVVWAICLMVWWIYAKNGKLSLKLSFSCLAVSALLLFWWGGLLRAGGWPAGEVRRLLAAGGVSCGLLAAAFMIWVEYLTRPLRSLKRYMDRIAEGNYQIQKKIRSNDEVSAVWSSMTAMCRALEEQRYRNRQMMKSYYRFVPRDIHRIFERDSILSLAAGEVRAVCGTVGIVSVQNREAVRESMRDEEYMEMVKNLFVLLTETVKNHGGILASSEFDLSGIKVLFPAAGPEVLFGLELLALCRERQRGNGEPGGAELFFLVHRTSYLYGLAGTVEQSLPFFVSGEMEFFSSQAGRFGGTGTGMVITEAAMDMLESKPENRYIGFFLLPESGERCRLYEVLGACAEAVRSAKRRSADKFQEGLSLYCRNDFYLARNAFSAAVKECPQDGIAKWYLFASEHYFNRGVEAEVDYSLFKQFDEAGGGHGFPV